MSTFIVYSSSTGAILRSGKCQDGIEAAQAQAGEMAVVDETGATVQTHYVLLGPPVVVVAKDAMSASIDVTYIPADGLTVATISGVPVGATLYVDGIYRATISDGSVEFSSESFGVHTLRLDHYRHLEVEFIIGVGVYVLPAVVEAERAIGAAAPLAAVVEVEAALAAHQERTIRVGAAAEVEIAVAAAWSRTARMDPAVESEFAVGAAAPLPPASETEAALDATLSQLAQLDPADELEEALDAA